MTNISALTFCLKLALVAETQDQVNRAVELAEQIAAGMTVDEVNAAVAETQDQVNRAVEMAEQIAAGMTVDEVNAAKEAACLQH